MAASSSITSARPTSTAGTAGVAGAAGAASSARASDLTQAQAVQGQRPDQAGRHRGAEEEERGIDAGLSTSRPCKVEAAAHDWLEHGLPIGARGRFTGMR